MTKLTKTIIFSILCVSTVYAAKDKASHSDDPNTIIETKKKQFVYCAYGPYAHKNLAVYLIKTNIPQDITQYMTLEEAIEKKSAIVDETGNVNNLTIQNNSDNTYIFIQSGDIVRGGKQDRVIGYDYIIPPKSKKIKLNSYCVEGGRWGARKGESVRRFGSSNNQIAFKELKLAVKETRSQGEVWHQVGKAQDTLTSNIGRSVKDADSPTSLQLTLEDKDVKKYSKEYVDSLVHCIDGKQDITGFVFAINGEINSADLYGSSDIFKKLWPKILESCAIEAVAKQNKNNDFTHPSIKTVEIFLEDIQAKSQNDKINEHIILTTNENEQKIIFDTYRPGRIEPIHRNYIRRDKNESSDKDNKSPAQIQRIVH